MVAFNQLETIEKTTLNGIVFASQLNKKVKSRFNGLSHLKTLNNKKLEKIKKQMLNALRKLYRLILYHYEIEMKIHLMV